MRERFVDPAREMRRFVDPAREIATRRGSNDRRRFVQTALSDERYTVV